MFELCQPLNLSMHHWNQLLAENTGAGATDPARPFLKLRGESPNIFGPPDTINRMLTIRDQRRAIER